MFIVFEFCCYKFRSPSREFTLYVTSVRGLTKQNQCGFSESLLFNSHQRFVLANREFLIAASIISPILAGSSPGRFDFINECDGAFPMFTPIRKINRITNIPSTSKKVIMTAITMTISVKFC